MASMRTFLAECYLPGVDQAAVAASARRARCIAGELHQRGDSIAYLGATLVPADEVVFHAFNAPTSAAVEAACRAAGLRFERVVESTGIPGEASATVMEDPR